MKPSENQPKSKDQKEIEERSRQECIEKEEKIATAFLIDPISTTIFILFGFFDE